MILAAANGLASSELWQPDYAADVLLPELFVQDTWKISPELSLDFGLRYEYPGAPFNNVKYLGVTPDTVSQLQCGGAAAGG